MAGLPWFELDVDFWESKKIRKLAARLREPLADAYVARLYAYCYRHVTDRFDPEVAAEAIEDACRWRGRRTTLFDALHAVGVLEREAGKVVVHGVKDRLAPHVEYRAKAAERQRKRREKVAESMRNGKGVARDVAGDVTGDSRVTSRPPLSLSVSLSDHRSDQALDGRTSTVPSAGEFAADLEAEASLSSPPAPPPRVPRRRAVVRLPGSNG